MARTIIQGDVGGVRDGVRAVLLMNRTTIRSKPSPPGDADAITSERGEDNTLLLNGRAHIRERVRVKVGDVRILIGASNHGSMSGKSVCA